MNLVNNPFCLLGANTRDDRSRLLALAEQSSLTVDPSACTKARAELSNPRSRLAAELAWLPGVSPRQAADLVMTLRTQPSSCFGTRALPPLARANLLASSLQSIGTIASAADWVEWSLALASAFEEVDPQALLHQINEDRSIAGFPVVPSPETLSDELGERRRFFKGVLRATLDQMPTEHLIEAVTKALSISTRDGVCQAPMILDDLIDAYQVDTQTFLATEAANAVKLIASIRKVVAEKSSLQIIDGKVAELERVVRNWDRVAQPVQLSLRARGLEDSASLSLAGDVRSLAVDLFNQHNLLAVSERLTKLIGELFSEVPEVHEVTQGDLSALQGIRTRQTEAQRRAAGEKLKWSEEIAFDGEFGLLFKERFRISTSGIQHDQVLIPLDQITLARWGAVRRFVNGIPVGTTYQLGYGNERSYRSVKLPNDQTYRTVTDKIWKAVGVRIIESLLKTLQSGNFLYFPGLTIGDGGIGIAKSLWGSKRTSYPWAEVVLSGGPGFLAVGPKDEQSRHVQLSYLDVNNVHFLEAILRTFFKSEKAQKVSDLLS